MTKQTTALNTPSNSDARSGRTHHRTIWLSDIHLGSKGCQAEYLLSFLKANSCDTLYLVGDIIDGWKLKSKVYWPQSHTNVIRRILTMAKRGTRIVFITGNHDEFLRKYSNRRYGNIELLDEACHYTADNKKLLVLHGDQFDEATTAYGKLSSFGAMAYDELVELNTNINDWRTRFGLGAWTLPVFVKRKTKTTFIAEYENWISGTAKQRGFDGAVCGHIHHVQNRTINAVQYLNCGDWVESCTALVESGDGEITIINWLAELDKRQEVVDINAAKGSANPLALLAEFNELAGQETAIQQEEAA